MKNLEEQQKAMRERNKRLELKAEGVGNELVREPSRQTEPAHVRPDENSLEYLKHRLAALERENADLRLELARLRQGSVNPQKSYEESRREQQHNFFKYSNIRRY